MMYMSVIHWMMVAVFLLIFLMCAVFIIKEGGKSKQTILITTFVVIMGALFIGLQILDSFVKKAEILAYHTSRNYNTESVNITGSIRNTGKINIGYCNIKIKIINKVKYDRNKKRVFYKASSVDNLFKGSSYTKNFIDDSFEAVEDLAPLRTKAFSKSIKVPTHFNNMKFYLHLKCH